jgi:hypothetical protein
MELHDWCAAAKLVAIGLMNRAFDVTVQKDLTVTGYTLMLHFTRALQVFETWCSWTMEKRPRQPLLAASDMEAGNVRDSEWLKQVDGKIDVSVTKAVDAAVGPAVQKAVDAAVGPAVQKAVDAALGALTQAVLELKSEMRGIRDEFRHEVDDMKDDLQEQGITIRRRHAPANSDPEQNV